MDTLIRILAVLTLLWGGWMYLKSSDADTELRRIRNELKLAKQELSNTQATYEAEDKKRETLAGEVNALKEGIQQLRKAITAKKEEKRQRIAQERQERLEEEREAQIEEEEKRRETEMALLEREKRLEREEKEREEAEQAERDAEYNKRIRDYEISRLQSKIESRIQALERYSTCSASAPPDKAGFRKVEILRMNWTSHAQAGIKAVKEGDRERFEQFAKKLLTTAKAIDYICNGGYVRDAMRFAGDGREILKLKEQLK